MGQRDPVHDDIVYKAWVAGLAVPALNVPYLPMIEPIIAAAVDQDAFALIATARLEWYKFESGGPSAVLAEYARWQRPGYVQLHLDHVPVIDEDGRRVDYLAVIREALDLGYPSIMVDGSRLSLEGNITATREVVALAHGAGAACEAELGAVLGHGVGPLPPYEELFASRQGFTSAEEARRFVAETGCDWLSVAIGNVHGAISGALKDAKKVEARLDLGHLDSLAAATRVPLVLHGGSGIAQEYLAGAMARGIAKINVAAEIRQAYERALRESGRITVAQKAVYERTCWLLCDVLRLAGSRRRLLGAAAAQEGENLATWSPTAG